MTVLSDWFFVSGSWTVRIINHWFL
jgi:hypothetical protein